MKPLISMIIVTYNSSKVVISCLNSIYKISKAHPLEIIVVDNASKDSTVKLIHSKFQKVSVIKNNTNEGFAKAVNKGVLYARGTYILLLNPDTLFINDISSNMIAFLQNKKDNGIIGCKILNSDRSLQPSAGRFPTIINVFLDRIPFIHRLFNTHLIRNESYYNYLQEPDWISGACFLTTKQIFKSLHGLDEKYFMYLEDVDFCYRSAKRKIPTYFIPTSYITHFDEGKTKSKKGFKAIQMRKGLLIFFNKYNSRQYAILWQYILDIESFFRPALRGSS